MAMISSAHPAGAVVEPKDVLQQDAQAHRQGGRRDTRDVVVPQPLPVDDELALRAERVPLTPNQVCDGAHGCLIVAATASANSRHPALPPMSDVLIPCATVFSTPPTISAAASVRRVVVVTGAEPVEQHRAGQDHRDRVGGVLAGDVGCGAVRGLRHGVGVGGVERRRDAQRPGDLAGEVGEDVAEHVLGDDHVELVGAADEVHGHGVDVEVVDADVRVVLGDLAADVAEQAGGHLQHVGLVHDGDLLAAPRCASSNAARAIRSHALRG